MSQFKAQKLLIMSCIEYTILAYGMLVILLKFDEKI